MQATLIVLIALRKVRLFLNLLLKLQISSFDSFLKLEIVLLL